MSAGRGHPEAAGKVRHVTERDQLGAMFGGDYCRWIIRRTRIADRKQGGKLFAGEHFGVLGHHPSEYGRFHKWCVVNFAQIDE